MSASESGGEQHVEQPRPKARRIRKHVSCLPCRERKIKCDRNVPNCATCIRRGIVGECRWGDERDNASVKNTPSTSQNWKEKEISEHIQRASNPNLYDLGIAAEQYSAFSLMAQEEKTVSGLFEAKRTKGSRLAQLCTFNPALWEKIMSHQLRLLPDRRLLHQFVSVYLREVEPLSQCMNSVILHNDLSMLWGNLKNIHPDEQSPKELDFALEAVTPPSSFWTDVRNYGLLSLVYALLYVTYDVMYLPRLHALNLFHECKDSEDFLRAIEDYYLLSEFFLHESECEEHATLWTLQALMLQQRRHLRMNRIGLGTLGYSNIIRLAKMMGLNRLGDTCEELERVRSKQAQNGNDKMFLQSFPCLTEFAPDDLPKRELGRKIWTTLVAHDWTLSMHVDFGYTISEGMNKTAPPASLTDEEVLQLSTLPLEVVRDPYRITSNVYCRLRLNISRCARMLSEICLERLSKREIMAPPYDEVIRLDEELRLILNSLPDYFRQDEHIKKSPRVLKIHREHPYLAVQRAFIQESIHHLLLRLHLTHLRAGLSELAFRRSLDTCIEGANIAVLVWEELRKTCNPNVVAPYLKWHLLCGALALSCVVAAKVGSSESLALQGINLHVHQQTLGKAIDFIDELGSDFSRGPVDFSKTVSKIRQFCGRERGKEPALTDTNVIPSADLAPDLQWTGANLFLPFDELNGENVGVLKDYPGMDLNSNMDTNPTFGMGEDTTLLAGLDFFLLSNDLGMY